MKTLLYEGFETFGSLAGLAERYPTSNFVGTPTFTRGRHFGTALGRRPGDAAFNSGRWRAEGLGLWENVVVGQSLYITEPDVSAYMLKFFRGGVEQGRVRVIDDGTGAYVIALEVNGAELARTGTITRDEWRAVEVSFTPHPTDGAFAVWVERELILVETGLEAAATGTTGIDAVEWAFDAKPAPTSFWAVDDIYLRGGDGSDWLTGTLGPIVVIGALAESDGFREDWTPSAGVDSFAMLDEPTIADDDTTYVAAQGLGKAVLIVPASLRSARRAPLGVQLEARARLTQAGGFSRLQLLLRQYGAEATGEKIDVASTAYANGLRVFETNPVTSAPWELGDVVGPSRIEAGVQTSA